MEILGKILIHGKEREILLKEEDGLYKYYFLDLIGVYTPKIPGQTIIFREDTVENRQKDQINDNEIKISSAEKQQIEHFLEKIRINEVLIEISRHSSLQQKLDFVNMPQLAKWLSRY